MSLSEAKIVLTAEQEEAVDALLRNPRRFSLLTGLAGTGKTTCMEMLTRRLEEQAPPGASVHLAAPTGKAASVLAKKTGRITQTVHALLYSQVFDKEEINDKGEKETRLVFDGDKGAIGPSDVVIIDEASMIGTRLHRDIDERAPAGARIIYVGDHGQLPPVRQQWGPDFSNPTANLTQIHRQAKDNPVITAAYHCREHSWPPAQSSGCGRYIFDRMTPLSTVAEHIGHAHERDAAKGEWPESVILCYTNRARQRFNTLARAARGFGKHGNGALVKGEVVRVMSTNYKHDVRNGELLRVIDPGRFYQDNNQPCHEGLVLERPDGTLATKAPIKTGPIGFIRRDYEDRLTRIKGKSFARRHTKSDWLHLDYGYAMTCHSAQGSEWRSVGVYLESALGRHAHKKEADFVARWTYTAVTRAAHSCYVFTGG